MTKQDLLARMQRLIDEGALVVHGHEMEGIRLDELDEFHAAVDMFGDATPAIDLELDRFVDCWPTGDRRIPEADDEHFMQDGNDYVLD